MPYEAKILLDSISPMGIRLTTWQLSYPRFVHAELMTHRVFSRNAASSRAIPINKLIERVEKDMAAPVWWGKNQSGMQARKELEGPALEEAKNAWDDARNAAILSAESLMATGLHKQLVNRVLEPFLFITTLVTATEWDNWYNLRAHEDAQPEIGWVASEMKKVLSTSTPTLLRPSEWHRPLMPDTSKLVEDGFKHKLNMISAARCARISYLTHDGERDPEKDIKLAERLLKSGHMCYDNQTEILTDSGWKYFPYLSEKDKVLAVDINSGISHFEYPSHIFSRTVNEDLYRVYGQQIDLKVTKNHNMITSKRMHNGSWTNFNFEPAKDLYKKPRRYLKSTNIVSAEEKIFLYEDSLNFIKLVGFFIGDGYASSKNTIQFHLKKKRKIEYLKSLGFTVTSNKDKYYINEPLLGHWMRSNLYDASTKEKIIPNEFLCFNTKQTEALLEGLKNSDGSKRRNTWTYSTTSKQLADMLQALLHLHGLVGNLTITNNYIYKINISSRKYPRVETNQVGRSLSYTEEFVPYSGRIYCATVSTGALLVRRNDKVVVSGNSPFEHVAECTDTDLMFGNFRGWRQYRKTIPGESIFIRRG